MIFRCSPTILLAIGAISISSATSVADESTSAKVSNAERTFVRSIEPLFIQKCGGCHGKAANEFKGDFDMRTRISLLTPGESGEVAVVPGHADKSPLVAAIEWKDGFEMPPKENDRLNKQQIALVREWINGGAPWPDAARKKLIQQQLGDGDGIAVRTSGGLSDSWTNRRYKPEDLWAYQPIQRDFSKWLKNPTGNPIDAFINDRLEAAGIQPLPQADRHTLIRRITFDLTGLPPTPAEIAAFINDKSDNAYDKLLTRLLASPRYGEHWGRHWLDVVRYADSSGFSNDWLRPNAWRYRDYVIQSFNNDKPYDRFIREQIAGDEIDETNAENLIAVGFLRMGPWEHTGMSVAAVTRQQFLDDVTNIVGVTFLGQELRCASCHDHKFDPIPTRDYYSIQSVFAPVQFAERDVPFQAFENQNGFKQHDERIQRLQNSGGIKSLSTLPEDARPVSEWDADTETKGHNKVRGKRRGILDRERHRTKPQALSVYSGANRIYQSNKSQNGVGKRGGNVPVVQILTGGSVESPSEAVQPGVLSVVSSTSPDHETAKIPRSMQGRRLAFAKWLTRKDNPLAARVMVNRVWQYHFGRGLAANPNNFGSTGKKPTHPELLDFLADYLINNGWSVKMLHRLIVTSQAWQRSSGQVSADVRGKDPNGELYAAFQPRRMSAEELRDSMLATSGELNLEMGGLPVRPEINMEVAMQPRHIMGSVGPAYQPSPTPAERNRRTIYAERIRTLRDPMLETFNQPGLDTSCERRDASTITPQVFTLINSSTSMDRAIAFASRLVKKSPDNPDEQIAQAFQLAFGRSPRDSEAQLCRAHFDRLLKQERTRTPEKVNRPEYVIRKMVEEMTGLEFYWVENLDLHPTHVPDIKPWTASAEVRALANICLVLFNSNEFIYID